ncbi:Mitochondrial import inner membrane translocase subunit Tim29 [Chionoecetes opilio]|uniref:Mitochondrial import inner membrane translocase subunit Tim29 n=1 Tax=Chionoecetes opilio TaxID=41210 RepID=A0A8J4YYX0_CHIOP|nr:Mitochondrial import inner membrane translocase subunit Tim29 [Chionoecetes opilio]
MEIEASPALRGGRLEKWGDYWKSVVYDYKEVVLETAVESRNRPLKATAYVSIIAGILYAVKTNPDERDYRDVLLKYCNESALLSARVRNAEVDDHLHYMGDCFDHGLVRRLSIGICSFLWVDNYSKECGVFKSQCGYLKPQYLTFHERVQDVGFLGRWWWTHQRMREFDVNHQELPHTEDSALNQRLELPPQQQYSRQHTRRPVLRQSSGIPERAGSVPGRAAGLDCDLSTPL